LHIATLARSQQLQITINVPKFVGKSQCRSIEQDCLEPRIAKLPPNALILPSAQIVLTLKLRPFCAQFHLREINFFVFSVLYVVFLFENEYEKTCYLKDGEGEPSNTEMVVL